jgi:hypothetical protein
MERVLIFMTQQAGASTLLSSLLAAAKLPTILEFLSRVEAALGLADGVPAILTETPHNALRRPPPADHPPDDTVLWRYLSLARFMSLLEHKTLWFSRMDQFEDPLEGTFTDAELEQMASLSDDSALPILGFSRAARSVKGETQSFLRIIETIRMTHFVSCWREGPHDSMAMWDIYGQGDGKVAIKSDAGRLKDTFATYDGSIYVGRVEYVPWDVANWPRNALLHCFRKDRSYEHEAEVRAVISGLKNLKIPMGALRIELTVDPASLITEVVVGPREQKETVKLVKTILHRCGLTVPVAASNRLKRRS